MTTGDTEAFATRLRAGGADRIREALADSDHSRSELLARAVRYYIDKNPDRIPAFRDERRVDCLAKAGILPPSVETDQTDFEKR